MKRERYGDIINASECMIKYDKYYSKIYIHRDLCIHINGRDSILLTCDMYDDLLDSVISFSNVLPYTMVDYEKEQAAICIVVNNKLFEETYLNIQKVMEREPLNSYIQFNTRETVLAKEGNVNINKEIKIKIKNGLDTLERK